MSRIAALSLLLVWACLAQPNIQIAAVTNSADFQPGLPQTGSLASIFCTGLQGPPGIITANSRPLPYDLAGVSVWINSVPAPILAVAFENGYQQINVQVPWELQRDPFSVDVLQNGGKAHTENAAAGQEWSIFFSDATGHAIVQHAADYSLVTTQNPAHADEYLIAYATNLGPVANTPPTGYRVPLSPLSPLLTPQGCPNYPFQQVISIGNVVAPITWVGLTPESIGIYQINFQVPPSISGDVPMRFEQSYWTQPFGDCSTSGGPRPVDKKSRSVLVPFR
ncbi:MAG: Glucose/sorbosone dehydrogenase-like protein [Bryobacterales bacterium]|nr:Glucose/sorbosone dehydrogenase-like protein [Bryobacterales bacterium]